MAFIEQPFWFHLHVIQYSHTNIFLFFWLCLHFQNVSCTFYASLTEVLNKYHLKKKKKKHWKNASFYLTKIFSSIKTGIFTSPVWVKNANSENTLATAYQAETALKVQWLEFLLWDNLINRLICIDCLLSASPDKPQSKSW